jgi:hypothetical protein
MVLTLWKGELDVHDLAFCVVTKSKSLNAAW